MGNYSKFITMANSPENCLIDWNKMDVSKLTQCLMREQYNLPSDERPKTLADMALIWDDTKFIGYFDKEYLESLQEFCRCLIPYNNYPRIYYEYPGFDTLAFIEFIPGKQQYIDVGFFEFAHLVNPWPSDERDEVMNAHEDYRLHFMKSLIDVPGWKINKLYELI